MRDVKQYCNYIYITAHKQESNISIDFYQYFFFFFFFETRRITNTFKLTTRLSFYLKD